MSGIDWQQELTRAALPHAVLGLLAHGGMHGYAMIDVLRSGGFPRTQGGTLYPLLRRLEEQGLVSHVWQHDTAGPGRKQFAITDGGRAELARAVEAWQQMDEALSRIRTSRKDNP